MSAFAASDIFRGIASDAFRRYEVSEARRARFDVMSAISRDEDGYIKPVQLYQPGSFYGDAYNQAAITSYVSAARTAAHDKFREAYIRNRNDPETFDGFVKAWIDRQSMEAPPELQNALRLDLAETAGQFKAGILDNVRRADEERRNATLHSDADLQLRDMWGYSVAGDAGGMAKAAAEVESLASALDNARDFKGAVAVRQAADRVRRFGPVIGSADALWRTREDAAAGEGPLDGYLTLARMAESGGQGDAKNPNSSAKGLYQFIDGTWLDQVKRNHPELAAGKSDAEILALRSDPGIQDRVMRSFTTENYNTLRQSGVIGVGRGELYLAHFLGAGGAAPVLTASPDTPIDQIRMANGERAVSDAAIKANASVLAGKTAGQVRAWAAQKMGDTAAAATLEGRYGTGVDALAAKAADILAHPDRYGANEAESRQLAGMVQAHASLLQAAKVTQASTKTADTAFSFGSAMQSWKNEIDGSDGFDPVSDPGKIRARALGLAAKFGKDPDSISSEIIGYAKSAFEKRTTLAETLKDMIQTRAMGGRVPATEKTTQAVDYMTKRAFGHDLSVFDQGDHGALTQTFQQTGLLPTFAVRQLKNIRALTDAKDENQGKALENAVGFVEQLAGQRGMSFATEYLPDLIGKTDADRLVELMGLRGSSLLRQNERINVERSNIESWKAQRWAALDPDPNKRPAKLKELVDKETTPGMLANAASAALSLGGDNALSQWLAPRVSQDYRTLVQNNAWANIPEYTKPEAAVAAARAEADKVSAYSTYLRRPGEDLTPQKRPYAPEAFYPADVFNEDLVKATTGTLNALRIKDTSWAKDIGAMAGLAAAAVQQPVLNSDIMRKLMEGGLPSVDRDLTESDVRKMVAAGLVEVQVSERPTAERKPAYQVFLNHQDRYLPLPGLERFRPEDRPGMQVEAARTGVAWARRFAEDTGMKLPAILPGMAVYAYRDLMDRLGRTIVDPLQRSERDLNDLTGTAAATYNVLKKQPPPESPRPAVPPSTTLPYSTQGAFPKPADE